MHYNILALKLPSQLGSYEFLSQAKKNFIFFSI